MGNIERFGHESIQTALAGRPKYQRTIRAGARADKTGAGAPSAAAGGLLPSRVF